MVKMLKGGEEVRERERARTTGRGRRKGLDKDLPRLHCSSKGVVNPANGHQDKQANPVMTDMIVGGSWGSGQRRRATRTLCGDNPRQAKHRHGRRTIGESVQKSTVVVAVCLMYRLKRELWWGCGG